MLFYKLFVKLLNLRITGLFFIEKWDHFSYSWFNEDLEIFELYFEIYVNLLFLQLMIQLAFAFYRCYGHLDILI